MLTHIFKERMKKNKFRIWNKLTKKFIFPEKKYSNKYFLDLDGNLYKDGELLDSNNYVIQQYINLNDKKNNEIYEGDIVEHRFMNKNKEDVLYQEIQWDKLTCSKCNGYYIDPSWEENFLITANNASVYATYSIMGPK
jgi:hypothetical protein